MEDIVNENKVIKKDIEHLEEKKKNDLIIEGINTER